MKKFYFYQTLLVILSVCFLSACSSVDNNSDPEVLIDDLDNSVSYTELIADEQTPEEWVVRQSYNSHTQGYILTFATQYTNKNRQSFYIIMHRDAARDIMLPSGKYSSLIKDESSDYYIYPWCEMWDNDTHIVIPQCQMYVTRTDIKKGVYKIDLYIRASDGNNYHLKHLGKISELELTQYY